MNDWNVQLYSKFEKERMQPSVDLTTRIPDHGINRIIDIGCGSGMSTLPLKKRWPDASITGVDYSDTMLEQAGSVLKDVTWLKRDCNLPLLDLGRFDLVFSNAAIQWLHNHSQVIDNLSQLLDDGGVLAIQIPYFTELLVEQAIKAAVKKFDCFTFDFTPEEMPVCFPPSYYYDELTKYFQTIDIWQTNYFNIMDNYEGILKFYEGTGLRPYLNKLDNDRQRLFLDLVLEEISKLHQVQRDGKVLFEFKRIFIIAKK